MAKKSPEFVHALVRNRGPRGSEPITLTTATGDVKVTTRKTETVVLTMVQFTQLYAQQRAAIRHEDGVLRMVDYWHQDDKGERSEVALPR